MQFLSHLRVRAGVLQLIIVLPGLWIFGRYLEAVVYAPALSITAIYLLPGIAGCLASANLAPFYISVGPAASVAALLGEQLLPPYPLGSDAEFPVHCLVWPGVSAGLWCRVVILSLAKLSYGICPSKPLLTEWTSCKSSPYFFHFEAKYSASSC